MSDPFDLDRFVAAQAPLWSAVREELAAGRKRSHWMWFVFPQHVTLGRSATARRYGLSGLAEARAWLRHPLLGARLAEATGLVLDVEGGDLHAIFGTPDDLKFRSSMTLFAAADGAFAGPVNAGGVAPCSMWTLALDRFCDGRPDPLTLDVLAREGSDVVEIEPSGAGGRARG